MTLVQKAREIITPLSKLMIFQVCTFRSYPLHPPILSGLEEFHKNTTKLSQWVPNCFSTPFHQSSSIIQITAPLGNTPDVTPFFPPLCPPTINCSTCITVMLGQATTQHHHDGFMTPGLALLMLSVSTTQPTNRNQQRHRNLATYRPLYHLWYFIISTDFRKHSHRKLLLKVTGSK